jgi:hypothetical protein
LALHTSGLLVDDSGLLVDDRWLRVHGGGGDGGLPSPPQVNGLPGDESRPQR